MKTKKMDRGRKRVSDRRGREIEERLGRERKAKGRKPLADPLPSYKIMAPQLQPLFMMH
jgi:hypothetical protein